MPLGHDAVDNIWIAFGKAFRRLASAEQQDASIHRSSEGTSQQQIPTMCGSSCRGEVSGAEWLTCFLHVVDVVI